MKRKTYLFILPVIMLVLMSCRFTGITINRQRLNGSGKIQSETREVHDIERVSLEYKGDITITQGDTESLTVEADDNLLPYIVTEMRGRELTLTVKDGYEFDADSTIRYSLKVKNLNRIAVSGAGNVKINDFKAGDLALDVAGTGNMKITNLQANDLRVNASGTGNFDLAGKVSTQDLTISGAGNYTCGDLRSTEAKVTINGAGNVTIWASDKLDIHINGFGNVNYYGSPKVTQGIAGGGGVKGLGEHK